MRIELGTIEKILRYPVKSMRGESLDSAEMGWHGLDGDRRLALRRTRERGGFPWLSASKLPELVLFTPKRPDGAGLDVLPTHVRTPEGQDLPIFGAELAEAIGHKLAAPVEMMQLKHGIFDDGTISLITSDTIDDIARRSGTTPDVRRFRPNILVRSAQGVPFEEDTWLGGVLSFGDQEDAAAVTVTLRDLRCVMVNFGPDDGRSTPEVMRAIVERTGNYAGVYATVTRGGTIAVGQRIWLHR